MTIAPAICYDLRFPELFRAETAAGAQLLPFANSNSPEALEAYRTGIAQPYWLGRPLFEPSATPSARS